MFDSAMPLVNLRQLQPIQIALRARAPLAWAMIGFALSGLIFSFSPVRALVPPVVGFGAIHPLTAVCMVGLGGSILRTKQYGAAPSLRIGLLGVILAVCMMRLMAGALVAYAGIAAIPAFGPTLGFVGSFSLEMAMTLGAIAAATLLRQGNGRWGTTFLLIGLGCVFNMILGVVFEVRGSVGAFALAGLMCSALAMVSMYVHRPFVRVAFLIGDIGSQTRVMAAVVTFVPVSVALVSGWMGAVGDLTLMDVGILTIVCSSMMIILLATSARHEGSVATRRRAEREIAMRSRTDTLTGALNRFGMTEAVEGAWLQFKTTGAQFGMILLDLDYFRRLDATFGHDDGEAVLGRVAQTVQAQLRGLDALGRWDQDEFMILLKIKEFSNIAIVADRLRQALVAADGPFCAGLAMAPARMEIAVGTSAFMQRDETAGAAIIRADTELNDVKTTGRDMLANLGEDVPFDILMEPEEDEADIAAAAA